MKFIGILVFVLCKIHKIENKLLPHSYMSGISTTDGKSQDLADSHVLDGEMEAEKVTGLKAYDEHEEDYDGELEKKIRSKKPCAIVVLSSVQNPTMQSLLRRYRYNSKGVLIPSSVKYFIKLPQGLRESPILMPLNDKAFSPLGGFVRYYKEVPPIPHTF